jgi:glutathione S-transferase
MSLILYQNDVSPHATRVRILAAAKGLALDIRVPPGGPDSAAYRAINPMGSVPTLDADGLLIPDAEAICEYLEDAWPHATLRPGDPAALARVRTLTRIVDLYLPPALLRLHLQLDPATRDPAEVDKGHEDLAAAAAYLDRYLEGPAYAVGGRLSQADCAIAPFLFFITRLVTSAYGRPSVLSPKLETYNREIAHDPYVAAAYTEMNADLAAIRQAANA